MAARVSRRTRQGALGAAAVLLALAGCTGTPGTGAGASGTGASGTVASGTGGSDTGGSDADRAPVTTTREVHLDPFTSSGRPAPWITVVDRAAAKCSASGVNVTDPDARRCMTTEGYFLYDPCFVRHLPRPDVALCLRNPTTSEAVRIRIVEDTPRPDGGESAGRPWFLELADGRHCVPAPSPAEDDPGGRPTYNCGRDDHLYGLPDTTGPVWTITNRLGDADAPGPPHPVRIRTAWL
ncbi:hypothetical protein GCM10009676_01010 [Prauserella halophila]|uniref:Lipoprotein n=1 Tax=Prauserella halophila TaxID=185641 RepID=A0ABN1VU76_9PSEU|nr:hypothetical protein [Prauserella halophila]